MPVRRLKPHMCLFLVFSGRSIWFYMDGFLASGGILIGDIFQKFLIFNFSRDAYKTPKTQIFPFLEFSAQYMWLLEVILFIVSGFLIYRDRYCRNWPKSHFLDIYDETKMPKILKLALFFYISGWPFIPICANESVRLFVPGSEQTSQQKVFCVSRYWRISYVSTSR